MSTRMIDKRDSSHILKVVVPKNLKFIRTPKESIQLIPSAYMNDICMTTEEKLKNTCTVRIPEKLELLAMEDSIIQKISAVNICEPIFQPFPSEIFFQQFEAYKKYEISFLLTNMDNVPRIVSVTQEVSPYFEVIHPPEAHQKVAPGLTLTFTVLFRPLENKDYEHEITCTTEREKYVVPIRAIGARAIVDIPDEIHFQICPVFMTSTKTILLRNIGNKDAKFSFFVLPPFSVSQVYGNIPINNNSQIDIEFNPTVVGKHDGHLYLRYDTGEVLYIALHAIAQDINIRLDKNSVRIDNTFISLTNQKTIFIQNRSDVVAKFKWSNYPSWNEETQQMNNFVGDLLQIKEAEMEAFFKDYPRDPNLRDKLSRLNRSNQYREKLIEDGKGLFYDEVFKIDPIEGEIWPNQTMQINVMFKPLEAKIYNKMAYCEITGRENRLPLQLRGEGKGPKVQLSVTVMDIGPIFIGSCHFYEVIIGNIGHINASYRITKIHSAFASNFTFHPEEGSINPGGHQAVKVKFQGSCLGDFDEIFKFEVTGSPQSVDLNIKGSVIGPTFYFNVEQLDFGQVSYGFRYKKTFKMHNTSLIPMNFRLHVPGDGIVNSIPSVKRSYYPKRTEPQTLPPREFKIMPCEGTLNALSFINITVQFVSNTVSYYDLALVVDVINVADRVFSMPIKARCMVPSLIVKNPVLNFNRCFLNYPYTQNVTLENLSSLPARYDLEPQPGNLEGISYNSHEPSGIVAPFSCYNVPLTIRVKTLESIVVPANFKVFGSNNYIPVQISCFGEGPVVHVLPLEVDWGVITVLKDVERKITLLNESPIPAKFEATMTRANSLFHVDPSSGVILPEDKMILTLTANINDIITFEDKIIMKFGDHSERYVTLKAFGEGSTIVADPPLSSLLNLGPHFSNKIFRKKIVFTNKGRRQQQVNWVVQTNPTIQNNSKELHGMNKLREKPNKVSPLPEPKPSVFEIIPHRFKLLPGESISVYLKGFVEKPADINEVVHCYSILGKHGGKKLVLVVNVKAQFIDPLLQFSRENIFFRTDKLPDMKLELLNEDLYLTNTAILPLTVNLQIPDPFKIVYNDEILSDVKTLIDVGNVCNLKIQFNPCYKDNLVTRIIERNLIISYEEHPHIDYIALRGEVYFPNLTFNQTEVDFGCIMNNSSQSKMISIMNKSPLDVKYKWTMFNKEIVCKPDQLNYASDHTSLSVDVGKTSNLNASKINYKDSKTNFKTFDIEDIYQMVINSELPEMFGGYVTHDEIDAIDKENFQVFCLVPMSGILHPGEMELIKVTYFGYPNTVVHVTAVCAVEGGPTYQIELTGEASYLSYEFDVLSIDYGEQKYDQMAEASITLTNTGLVQCSFTSMNTLTIDDEITPRTPIVVPSSGQIKSGESQIIVIKYLAGFPGKFDSSFSIQVDHFRPEIITLVGTGIFPHLLVNLPRLKKDNFYQNALQAAKETMANKTLSSEAKKENGEEVNNTEDVDNEHNKEIELQKEIDRSAIIMLIKGEANGFHSPNMDSYYNTLYTIPTYRAMKETLKSVKSKPFLPAYELDLGFVILGKITSRTITLTNCGNSPISFKSQNDNLQSWGFKIDLHKVVNLPSQENANFQITFDPRSANLTNGPIETQININVTNGPQVIIRLRAHITMPDMEISSESLNFENVKCGECKIMSIQLHNHQHVVCEWSYLSNSAKKVTTNKNDTSDSTIKATRHKIFEIIPPNGVLHPGQRVNIQVKFMPIEGKYYEKRIPIRIALSSEKIIILCQGLGIEPVLQFQPENIRFRTILPHSTGDEKEIKVYNPMDFPIEFYSVDFDTYYLEEEKILRMMRGYDEFKTLLLPPRSAGEKLPPELIDYYKEKTRKLREMEKTLKEGQSALSSVSECVPEPETKEVTDHSKYSSVDNVTNEGSGDYNDKQAVEEPEDLKTKDTENNAGVGELEMTPVAAAITRYLGIDLSPDGKSATAVELANHYDIPVLNIDDMIIEAIAKGTTAADMRAREFCTEAAVRRREEQKPEEAEEKKMTLSTTDNLLSGGVIPRKISHKAGNNKAVSEGASQIFTSPPPLIYPVVKELNIKSAIYGDLNLMSCILPEDVVVEILTDRIQLPDCHKGFVIDGLESVFAANYPIIEQIILKALNNRRYIFHVTIKLDFFIYQFRKKELKERLEREKNLEEERQKRWIEDMSEDEYDAMTEEQRIEVENQLMAIKKNRMENRRKKVRTLSIEGIKTKDDNADDPYKDMQKEDLPILQKFQFFDNSYKDVSEILEFWDRTTLVVKYPLSPSEKSELEDPIIHSAKKNVRGKGREVVDKDKERALISTIHLEKKASLAFLTTDESETVKEKLDIFTGVPNIVIDCMESGTSHFNDVLNSGKLPSVAEVLDGIGLGLKGPPIPPPSTFAIVNYPVKRKPLHTAEIAKQYNFVGPSHSEQNLYTEYKARDFDPDEVSITTSVKQKVKQERQRKFGDKRNSVKDKKQRGSASPMLGVSSDDVLRLCNFRWVVPPKSTINLRIRFVSDELGEFNKELTFEIVGTKKVYQVHTLGLCVFPTICQDPRVVFRRIRKKREPDEIVHKRYIMATETFEFGPLLVGRYLESVREYPENIEILTILNTSPVECEISFGLMKDTKSETFSLDPPNMVLPPQQSKELAIWAFPRVVKLIEDAIVCCIKDNPEPIIFKINCESFRPEIEEEKRTIRMRNRTKIPISWKVTGLENLGEEFTMSSTGGTLAPLAELPLHAYFQAKKPVVTSKKQIRIEVMDIDYTMKASSEIITVFGEAYDVAIDINFPKVSNAEEDRCIEFGTVKVSDDSKQSITLKNKGKYDILFELVPNTDPITCKALANLFTMTPARGILGPLDRPVTCQVQFRAQGEITIKDQIVYRCLIIDPAGDTLVATLPIRMSVHAVYSKYVISPDCDIDFGEMLANIKRTRSITIENKGDFDFKFSVFRNYPEKELNSTKPRRLEPAQARCTAGIFTIAPASGFVAPGAQTTMFIDCIGENLGVFAEELSIDLTEQDPKKAPNGIIYILKAEICAPAIVTDDIYQIFEEQRICKSLSNWTHYNKIDSGGVYGEMEKKFMFCNVIVGNKAKARFKIVNANKVPCDVTISLRNQPVRGPRPLAAEAFEVVPTKIQILNHTHIFATVTFSPLAMQMYQTTFEAVVESNSAIKADPLIFDICGEGTLPQITITQPSICNQYGQPMLLFKQNFVGNSETLKIVISNFANLPCKVKVELFDTENVFSLKPIERVIEEDFPSEIEPTVKKSVSVKTVALDCNEKTEFQVTFQPKEATKSQARILVEVQDNPYETQTIHLTGEGYFEEITFEDIYLDQTLEEKYQNDLIGKNQVRKANTMLFGDCHIGKPKTQSLTIRNRNQVDTVSFQWQVKDPLSFSPQIGHLRPGQSKRIVLTLHPTQPIVLQDENILCSVKKITFDKPLLQVPDWDDRIHVIKWIELESTPQSTTLPDNATVRDITASGYHKRTKVVEIEPEPVNSLIPGTERDISLFVSCTAEYCKYECKTSLINFKDTYMFQTRSYKFPFTNKGNVQLEFNWQVFSSDFPSHDETLEVGAASQSNPYIPFTIEPAFGTIPGNTIYEFTVKFSPLKPSETNGKLICSISNIDEDVEIPRIVVKGKGLMPYCHFELKESDYITSARRDPKRCGPGGALPSSPIDPSTHVIEIECIGYLSTVVKKFSIFNPTEEIYSYEWINMDEKKHSSGFSCLTPGEYVKAGKKSEIIFEFNPTDTTEVGYNESFWEFQIAQQHIQIPFLLVAKVREPDVLFEKSNLHFPNLLVEHKVEQTIYIMNNENVAYTFYFTEDSCFSAGLPSRLEITPSAGTLPAKSRFPIKLSFLPLVTNIVSFNLKCIVVGKVTPLQINVKGGGYSVECAVFCADSEGIVMELTKTGDNEIDFGNVEVHETVTRTVTISNSGKVYFDFEWSLNEKASQLLEISNLSDYVKSGKKSVSVISFCPSKKLSLLGCKFYLKISNGPTYDIFLTGDSLYPKLEFSFLTYNFGNCFLHKAGMEPKVAVLQIKNNDKKNISLDCQYISTKHLMYDFKVTVIEPKKSISISFSFYPREAIKYTELVQFLINGHTLKEVTFIGRGIKMEIEIVNKKKLVKLDSYQVGYTIKRSVQIINRTPISVTLSVECNPNSNYLKEPGVLTILPSTPVTLPPNSGTYKIQIIFVPKSRIPPFSEEIFLERAGICEPLIMIKGFCLAMELELETSLIQFGAVVLKSFSTRKVVLNNT
ncbi:hypothetical protein Ahia01_000197500, partial [Argonauta hians]